MILCAAPIVRSIYTIFGHMFLGSYGCEIRCPMNSLVLIMSLPCLKRNEKRRC